MFARTRNFNALRACDIMLIHGQADQNRSSHKPLGAKSITGIAAHYGVTLRTLRYYEERGLLSPMRIKACRYYSTKDEIRLQLIQKGKKLGFSLAATEKLIASVDPSASRDIHDVSLPLNREQIADQIAVLEKHRTRLLTALEHLYDAQKNAR